MWYQIWVLGPLLLLSVQHNQKVESTLAMPRKLSCCVPIKYDHFRSFVADESIVINPVDTSEQLVDILTKSLGHKSFSCLRKQPMGWYFLVCYVSFILLCLQFQGERENPRL